MRTGIALSILTVITLSACGDWNGPPPELVFIKVSTERCLPDGFRSYVVNGTGDRVRARVQTATADDRGGTRYSYRWYTIEPQGRKPVGCSVYLRTSFSVVKWERDEEESSRLSSLLDSPDGELLDSFELSTVSPVAACRALCDGPRGGQECVKIAVLPPSVAQGLSSLIDQLGQNEDVTKTELMELFEIDTDPCDRSEAAFTEGLLLNTGTACYAASDLALGDVTIPLEFHMPSKMSGEVVTELSHGRTVLRFDAGPEAPHLLVGQPSDRRSRQIADALRSYAGRIVAADGTTDRLYVATLRGCWKLGLEIE